MCHRSSSDLLPAKEQDDYIIVPKAATKSLTRAALFPCPSEPSVTKIEPLSGVAGARRSSFRELRESWVFSGRLCWLQREQGPETRWSTKRGGGDAENDVGHEGKKTQRQRDAPASRPICAEEKKARCIATERAIHLHRRKERAGWKEKGGATVCRAHRNMAAGAEPISAAGVIFPFCRRHLPLERAEPSRGETLATQHRRPEQGCAAAPAFQRLPRCCAKTCCGRAESFSIVLLVKLHANHIKKVRLGSQSDGTDSNLSESSRYLRRINAAM